MAISSIQSIDIYIGAAILGIFTGLGNVAGQWVFKKYFEKKLNGIHHKIRRVMK